MQARPFLQAALQKWQCTVSECQLPRLQQAVQALAVSVARAGILDKLLLPFYSWPLDLHACVNGHEKQSSECNSSSLLAGSAEASYPHNDNK